MTLGDAYVNGFDAGRAGKPCENPDNWNAPLHAAWLRGWREGAIVRKAEQAAKEGLMR